jgi:signal transduction histidine kinase
MTPLRSTDVPVAPQRVNCLIVDDLAENLLSMAALLRSDEVEVLQASSGPEALELLLANDVALALLDVQMPGMDGFELAELMRGTERTRDIPIIFVTAGNHDQRRVFKGYEAGAVDFIHKPVDVHVLKTKASVFFHLHRQKRQIAEELNHRTEALRINEMFIAVLAHDLRNPLATIITAADLLNRRDGDNQLARIAQGILASGRRMGRMINDLLDLVRARLAGGILLQRQPCDLGEIVGSVLLEQQTARPQRSIEVHQTGELTGDWDQGRLAQVASNLIGNALQHGDISEPVVVSLDGSSSTCVEFVVKNHGTIPADKRANLFDPFRSGQGGASPTAGLGLGLYIAQQILHAHGGTVVLDASSANETRFCVAIPRAAV